MSFTFQEFISTLKNFWVKRGCIMWFPHHDMVGAGTNNPATILRMLGPEPHRIVYEEPSFRPDDGRYGENPNRVQMHHQLQVVLKPIPHNIQDLYLESLEAVGLSIGENDIRFVEDNWAAPVIGAWGLGWEVWLNGMEISQYTYFQQAGGLPLSPPAVELTYGLERIAMALQGVSSLWDIQWSDHYTYGDLLKKQEVEYCIYNFEEASVARTSSFFREYEAEASHAIEKGLPIPAYDYLCRCSHAFNILDARGAVGVSERAQFFARMRTLTRRVADAYVASREKLGFPLVAQTPKDYLPFPQKEIEAPLLQQGKGTFLFELGFEELAPSAAKDLATYFREHFEKRVVEEKLSFSSSVIEATPRRLAVILYELTSSQPQLVEKIKGPARSLCEKNQGVLLGFAKKQGVDLENVTFEDFDGTQFAIASVSPPPKSVSDILPRIITDLLMDFSSGKTMRWLPDFVDEKKISFNRPIRWIVSLFDDHVLPLTYAGLKASRVTCGPRWRVSPKISLSSASSYLSTLQNEGIILSSSLRRDAIIQSLNALTIEHKALGINNDDLVDEITFLVENPTPFVGTLPEIAREIPPIVIRKVIEKHVRCFSLFSSEKKTALPLFIGIANYSERVPSSVQRGFERVIGARLTDAHFFITKDKKEPLSSFIPRLEGLVLHDKLGSLLDKTKRVEALALEAVYHFSLGDAAVTILQKAVPLAKADLATSMVQEMTSLQGEVGALYLAHEGVEEEIVTIVRDHYLPRFASDALPSSPLARIVGILHRVDTIVGFFGIGIEPSGSTDPFGLRREAVGLLALLGETPSLHTRLLLEKAYSRFPMLSRSLDDTCCAVSEFLEKRLEIQLREQGHESSLVRAVIAVQGFNSHKALQIISELDALLTNPRFTESVPAYTRCMHLLMNACEQGMEVDTHHNEALTSEPEKQLLSSLSAFPTTSDHELTVLEAGTLLMAHADVINSFFESSMIMAPEVHIRAQRLGLLRRFTYLFAPHADLSLLSRSPHRATNGKQDEPSV
jgi:glycyl-tRNA synthetase